MPRTVPTTVSTATVKDVTTPVYLIYMAWDAASPDWSRICTWDTAITWGGYTWQPAGARVRSLSLNGGTLELPNGNDDPWLSLAADVRGRVIQVYEHHTDETASPQADAVQIFGGVMDAVEITKQGISIGLISDALSKSFPHTSIDPSVYTYLLTKGDRLYWGPDIVKIE